MKKDHPEITGIKNICNISTGAKTTKPVCDVIKKDKKPKDKKNPTR